MAEHSRKSSKRGVRGFSLFEIGLTVAVLSVLALVAVPTFQYTLRRSKEVELRLHLRQLRRAIDEYHRFAMQGLVMQEDVSQDFYPPDLETLVEGVELVGDPTGKKIRFLRRVPLCPMTGDVEWGMRSTRDDWDSSIWGGENVFDVYCLSEAESLDGRTHYNEW